MAKEDLNRFRSLLLSNEDFQEKLRKAAAEYTGGKDEKSVFDNLLLPLAQEYGMKAISFNNLLQQLGIQHNAGGYWVITPDYAGRDFTQTKQITVHDNGRAVRKPFTVWTEAGRQFIHDMLSRQGIKPVTGKGGSV